MVFHAFWLGLFKVDFRSLSEQLRTITFNRHVADKLTVISSVDSIWSFYCAIFHKEKQRFAFTMCKLSLYKLSLKTTLLLLRFKFCNGSKFIWFKSGNVNSIYFHAVRQTTNLNTRFITLRQKAQPSTYYMPWLILFLKLMHFYECQWSPIYKQITQFGIEIYKSQ